MKQQVGFKPGTFGTFPPVGVAGGVVTYNTFPLVGETFLWFDVQHSCIEHEKCISVCYNDDSSKFSVCSVYYNIDRLG